MKIVHPALTILYMSTCSVLIGVLLSWAVESWLSPFVIGPVSLVAGLRILEAIVDLTAKARRRSREIVQTSAMDKLDPPAKRRDFAG